MRIFRLLPHKAQKLLSQKGTKRKGLKGAKYEVPRIAEGKYLKLLYETFKERGMLDTNINELKNSICPKCDMGALCTKEQSAGKLSPLCLDALATFCFKQSE